MKASDSDKEWNLTTIPPEGHPDVGQYCYGLFETAKLEKERLDLPSRWMQGFSLYRGYHKKGPKKQNFLTINLYFANVERTKANITARNPVAEVIDLDGYGDDADQLLTAKIRKWWKDTGQRKTLSTTVLKMEKYGITIEKPVYDRKRKNPDIVVVDPYAFFPAPGNYADISLDMPYACHAHPEVVEIIESKYGVKDVETDDVYSILGEDREENRPIPSGTYYDTTNAQGNYAKVMHPHGKSEDIRQRRALQIEVWIRDYTKVKVKTDTGDFDKETGEVFYTESEVLKYPDGIRKVTICKGTPKDRKNTANIMVLDDRPNPNINPYLPPELASKTHAWGRLPFYKANSYEDTTSIWGFSAAEQVADLNYKIDEIISRVVAYIMKVMSPPFIVPEGFGITQDMITNKPGLVLMPNRAGFKAECGYLQVPNLPTDFFKTLDVIIKFFDRVYQIEDADRGVGPTGVVAASAIVALQERNAVLIQQKINAVDFLVEERGKWAISLYQNFGTSLDIIDVEGTTREFIGTEYAGRKFGYVVESGSTRPKTSLQVEEQAKELYGAGAIDRQALLETLNFPNWKQIIERVGEGQLNQALQILVQAGLPQEMAIELQQLLMQNQGGPGNRPQQKPAGGQAIPRAEQGKVPPEAVSPAGVSAGM